MEKEKNENKMSAEQEFTELLECKAMKAGQRSIVEVAQDVLDGRKAVSISVSKEVNEPLKAQSQARANIFNDALGFVEYLNKYKSDETVVWADLNALEARAVIDELSKDQREYIALVPQVHPLFAPWASLQSRIAILSFVDFLIDNKRSVISPCADELVRIFSNIKASNNLVYHRGRGNGSANGLVCHFKVETAGSQSEIVDIPEMIFVEAPMFVGGALEQFEIDVVVDMCQGEVCVRLGLGDLNAKRIENFERMISDVRAVDGICFCYGKPQQVDWMYH